MRTGIYVYSDSVSFKLRSEYKNVILFINPNGDKQIPVTNGAVSLKYGIYKIVSDKPTEIRVASGSVGDADIVVVTNDKDPWPDPPAKFSQAFSEVAPASLKKFMPQSGGVGKQPKARPATKARSAARPAATPPAQR